MPQSNKVELKVVQKSSFNGKSHFNQGTAPVGYLVPIMVDELIPNQTVDIKMAVAASLPPLATDTFMNLDYCVEAFFVPHRLCYAGFESWFTQNADRSIKYNDGNGSVAPTFTSVVACFPRYNILVNNSGTANAAHTIISAPHTLLDYLSAFYQDASANASGYVPVNPLPIIAYNLVWDNWYRNVLVQQSAFAKPAGTSTYGTPQKSPWITLPYITPNSTTAVDYSVDGADLVSVSDGTLTPTSAKFWQFTFADGHWFWSCRQRNFGFDYFTNSWPSPQAGDAVSVQADANGLISIAALRGANSLQQWEEAGLYCPRLVESVRARYGAHLSDGVAQRPICLGSGRYSVYSRGVDITAANANANATNPFAANAGAQAARAYANGTEHIVDSFTANEPGYLFIIGSLVPSVTYSSGIDRLMLRYMRNNAGTRTEFADPMLQNTGNQPIYMAELNASLYGQSAGAWPIFAYTDRYADFFVKRSSVHGLLRESIGNDTSPSAGSLSAFVAQRGFSSTSTVTMSDAFLKIPTNYLDNVTAVASTLSDYGYWYECGFNYKTSMPMAEYSIPSLQNPAYEHGKTITVHRGGFRF